MISSKKSPTLSILCPNLVKSLKVVLSNLPSILRDVVSSPHVLPKSHLGSFIAFGDLNLEEHNVKIL